MRFMRMFQSNFPHRSVLSLSNAIVGASILSMPYCFQQCGVILATLLMIVCAFFTSFSCKILIAASQMTHTNKYEFLAFRVMGNSMKLLVEISSISLLCGSIIAYEMVIGDLGSMVFSQTFSITNSSVVRGLVMIIFTATITFPLSLSERFDNLTPISIQSIIFYLLFCIYTIFQFLMKPNESPSVGESLVYWRWSGIFLSLPIISLSFSCQTMLFVVYSELSESTCHAMNNVIDLSVTLVGFIYFIAGLFGYLNFYSEYPSIPGNVMKIFSTSFFQQLFLWGFLLNCTTGIPFMVNPTRSSLYTLWNDRQQQSLFGERHAIPRRLFVVFTGFVVFVPMFIALCIPNLEFILALTGASSGQLICYILPAILTFRLMTTDVDRWKTKILFVVGVVSMIICTFMTFVDEFQLSNGHREKRSTNFSDEPMKNTNDSAVVNNFFT